MLLVAVAIVREWFSQIVPLNAMVIKRGASKRPVDVVLWHGYHVVRLDIFRHVSMQEGIGFTVAERPFSFSRIGLFGNQ